MRLEEMYPRWKPSVNFVIVSGQRAGGTYLAECLSNHPEVFCVRGEPFHGRSVWARLDHLRRLRIIFDQNWHVASGFKITYSQLMGEESKAVWPAVKKRGARIIYLTRENVLAQALSQLHYLQDRTFPKHIYDTTSHRAARVHLSARTVVARCKRIEEAVDATRCAIEASGLRMLEVEYGGITSDGGEIPAREASRICEFLDITPEPLRCQMRRVHWMHYREIVENWDSLEAQLRASPYGKWVDQL